MLTIPMRVIAGTFRSRTLKAPPGVSTRPTSDRLRETLFNILAPRIEGARFLDLYAGSGAVGIEAVSRGAVHVTFVEQSPAAVAVLRANLTALKITKNIRVDDGKVSGFLGKAQQSGQHFELIFLDPPYEAVEEYAATLAALKVLVAPGGLVIAEHRSKQGFAERLGPLVRTRLLEQGEAALSFYSVED